MSFVGREALAFLTDRVDDVDPGASSHWRYYHKDFRVDAAGRLSGLCGFGSCGRPYRGIRRTLHVVLQRRYRAMSRGSGSFDRLDRIASTVTACQDRAYDLDVLRQTLTLALLEPYLSRFRGKARVAIIGDGYASLTTLLVASGLARQVVLVNLNRTLLVDLKYFDKWAACNPGHEFRLAVDAADIDECLKLDNNSVIALQAANYSLLMRAPLDLAVNIASMQEMDPGTVAHYFAALRAAADCRPLYFYCCNREEKRLPGGEVTRFADYPWEESDEVLFDELCPWHQEYYSVTPPFYRKYDGPIRHRLIKIQPRNDPNQENSEGMR